jgi:hypothetical protein
VIDGTKGKTAADGRAVKCARLPAYAGQARLRVRKALTRNGLTGVETPVSAQAPAHVWASTAMRHRERREIRLRAGDVPRASGTVNPAG